VAARLRLRVSFAGLGGLGLVRPGLRPAHPQATTGALPGWREPRRP
jgi:hypothetical protein